MRDEEQLRQDLANACRIVAAYGLSDLVFGHLSARLDEPDRALMKAAGMGLEEVAPESLITIDFEGHIVSGQGRRHREYPIHTEVLRARPDVGAVVHVHPAFGIALPVRGLELQAVCEEADLFTPGVPVFNEFAHLVETLEEGRAVARKLGDRKAVFLLNHGVVVTGGTVAEACVNAIMLERACQIQLLAQADPDRAVRTAREEDQRLVAAARGDGAREVFDYLVRRLDSEHGQPYVHRAVKG